MILLTQQSQEITDMRHRLVWDLWPNPVYSC